MKARPLGSRRDRASRSGEGGSATPPRSPSELDIVALQGVIGNRATTAALSGAVSVQRQDTRDAAYPRIHHVHIPEAAPVDPVLRRGMRGEAVGRLQAAINASSNGHMLVEDGRFGPRTHNFVRAFQAYVGQRRTGVVTALTWHMLRRLARTRGWNPRAGGHSEHHEYEEEIGGQVAVGTAAYDVSISSRECRVTVGIRFTGAPPRANTQRWLDGITTYWNVFTLHKQLPNGTGPAIPLVFQPVVGGIHHQVEVIAGPGRSNESEWYLGDPEPEFLAAHEFGHMIGLEDEYQRRHNDYVAVTGEQPPGSTAGSPFDPRLVAEELFFAVRTTSPPPATTEEQNFARRAAVWTVVQDRQVYEPGSYARAINDSYRDRVGRDLAADLLAIDDPDDTLGGMYEVISRFRFSSTSLMGAGRGIDPHTHPKQPRHVRHFANLVGESLGGTWEPMLSR